MLNLQKNQELVANIQIKLNVRTQGLVLWHHQ